MGLILLFSTYLTNYTSESLLLLLVVNAVMNLYAS